MPDHRFMNNAPIGKDRQQTWTIRLILRTTMESAAHHPHQMMQTSVPFAQNAVFLRIRDATNLTGLV